MMMLNLILHNFPISCPLLNGHIYWGYSSYITSKCRSPGPPAALSADESSHFASLIRGCAAGIDNVAWQKYGDMAAMDENAW